MGRILGILGLVILAACNDKDEPLDDVVTVTIDNQSSEAVYGRAESYDGDENHKFTLSPGATTSFDIWVDHKLKVAVWRTSDDFVLFADFWEARELEKLDERVTVIIGP